jgi:hypothetical protein
MYGYWTGSKLAKMNPHQIWNPKSFTPGSPRLLRALHMVVVSSEGDQAYRDCYLGLPICHRVVGVSHVGCSGTFLSNDDAIERYLNDQSLASAIKLDFEIPIDRAIRDTTVIEFLTHTSADVREESLFLVFDDEDGKNTHLVRERFPEHQIITVVKGVGFNIDDLPTMFSQPEALLTSRRILVAKDRFEGRGFYSGQTVFLPDFSEFFEQMDAMKDSAYIFAMLAIMARVGPDYSGSIWGSQGGAEGAIRSARAMFGLKGAVSPQDLASAVSWADGERPEE